MNARLIGSPMLTYPAQDAGRICGFFFFAVLLNMLSQTTEVKAKSLRIARLILKVRYVCGYLDEVL